MKLFSRPRAFPFAAGIAACLAMAAAPPAIALEDAESLSDPDREKRGSLRARGIDIQLGYANELATNIRGGERRLARQAGQLVLGTAFDPGRLWDWQGAVFRIAITGRHGHDLAADARLGTLQQVQEIYGRNQTWRLTQLWYSQELFGDRAQLKLGRVTVGEDFAAFSCHFMNLTFCGSQPGNLVGHYWYSWPVSQWGAVLKARGNTDTYLKLAAYQVNPSYLLTRNAIRPNNPAGTTGALVPLEFGWTPVFADGVDGSYKVGAWYNTSRYPDVRSDISGGSAAVSGLPFAERRGAYGGYVNIEQQLTRGNMTAPQSGLRTFFNATQADRATSATDRQVALGMIYTGPFAAQPADDLALSVGVTHLNRRLARYRAEAGSPVRRYGWGNEYAAELHYTWRTREWLTLRPSIQYIRHPGGTAANDDALVLGLQASVLFQN